MFYVLVGDLQYLLQVNTYIEDCIAQKYPLIKILRLVCLQSVCNSGLKQKVLDYYKREILQVRRMKKSIMETTTWERCMPRAWRGEFK